MGDFLFGLFSVCALFAACLLLAVLIDKVFPLKKTEKKDKSQIYYIGDLAQKPKHKSKKGVAIRGELLSKKQLSRLLEEED